VTGQPAQLHFDLGAGSFKGIGDVQPYFHSPDSVLLEIFRHGKLSRSIASTSGLLKNSLRSPRTGDEQDGNFVFGLQH
jgi:hypothetical protein